MQLSLITQIIDKVSDLIKIKFDQIKIDAQSQFSSFLARVIIFFALSILFTFIVLFLGLGLAFYLNNLWQSTFLGFGVVSGILLLGFILLVVLAKSQSFAKAIERAIIETEVEKDETL